MLKEFSLLLKVCAIFTAANFESKVLIKLGSVEWNHPKLGKRVVMRGWLRKDKRIGEGKKVKSRRKRLYIFRIRILLAYPSIYGSSEGPYRKYKELPPRSSLSEILLEMHIEHGTLGPFRLLVPMHPPLYPPIITGHVCEFSYIIQTRYNYGSSSWVDNK